MADTPTVVFYTDEHGNISSYANGDVEVLWVSDLTPGDRIYRADPDPIPKGMIDGPIGSSFDGSPAMIRLERGIKEAFGESPLTVVEGDAG